MAQRIEETIEIDAAPAAVWQALTDASAIPRWMCEPGVDLEVVTDWTVGRPIVLRGHHHARFEDRGVVLQFDPPRRLVYTHLSSLSRLPDRPDSYSTLEFDLTPVAGRTALTLEIHGFPLETIYKHLQFYWRGTLPILRDFVERRGAAG